MSGSDRILRSELRTRVIYAREVRTHCSESEGLGITGALAGVQADTAADLATATVVVAGLLLDSWRALVRVERFTCRVACVRSVGAPWVVWHARTVRAWVPRGPGAGSSRRGGTHRTGDRWGVARRHAVGPAGPRNRCLRDRSLPGDPLVRRDDGGTGSTGLVGGLGRLPRVICPPPPRSSADAPTTPTAIRPPGDALLSVPSCANSNRSAT